MVLLYNSANAICLKCKINLIKKTTQSKALMCKLLNGAYCDFIKDQNRNKKIRISFVCSSHVTGKDNGKDFFAHTVMISWEVK